MGAARDNLLDTLQRMEKAGVLQRNLPSPYSLPIFLAQKKSTPSKSFFQHTDLNVPDSENSEEKDSETINILDSENSEKKDSATDVKNVKSDNTDKGEGNYTVEEKNTKNPNETNFKDEHNIKGKDNIKDRSKEDNVRKVIQIRRDPELHQIVTDYHIIELQVQKLIALKDKKGKKEKDKLEDLIALNCENLELNVDLVRDRRSEPLLNIIKQKILQVGDIMDKVISYRNSASESIPVTNAPSETMTVKNTSSDTAVANKMSAQSRTYADAVTGQDTHSW